MFTIEIYDGANMSTTNKMIYVHKKNKKGKNSMLQFEYGDIVQITGKFEVPECQRNYKGFDYGLYLKTKGVIGNLEILQIKKIDIKMKKVNVLQSLQTLINKKAIYMSELIKDRAYLVLPEQTASIFIGLLLGDTLGISDEIMQNFRNANMSHVLAVSGMHMSYLIIISMFIFRKLIGKRKGYFASIFLIISYMFLTGFSASIVRAGIMGILVIIAKLSYKCSDILTNISIAALIILICNPYALLDLGFQLSFGGTLGIVLFHKDSKKKKIKDILFVTISAQLVILPISLFHFNTFNIYFLLSNLFIGFVIGPIMACGFMFLVCILINLRTGREDVYYT